MDFVNINKLFSSEYYSVPDYQRDYEWGIPENSTLLDDVLSLLVETDQRMKHFIGAIVTVPYEETNGVNKSLVFSQYSISDSEIKHIVDGQQRLTSISLMISALKNILDQDSDVNDSIKTNLMGVLSSLLLGNKFRNSDYNKAPRIILNGNTGYCYNTDILKVREEIANRKFRGARHLLAVSKLYTEGIIKYRDKLLLDNKFDDATAFYRKFVDTITTRITLVEITCEGSTNAFQVFDSLNGKGLDLTAADRIKNILLSWAGPQDKAAQKWDALVELTTENYISNYFLTLFYYNCGERISKNKLPEKFKSIYQQSAMNNFSYFYGNLKETSILYGNLRLSKTAIAHLDERLKDLQQLNLDQVYVLLFAVAYHYRSQNIMQANDYLNFIIALTSLVVRMQICDMSMNKLDVIFRKCIKAMKESNAALSLINQIITDEKSSITDELFRTKFKQFSTTDNKLSEFYLRHIENYRRKQVNNRNMVSRNLTVEHIIPQTLDDIQSWYGIEAIPVEIEEDFKMSVQQNIGNKILLFGDDNSSAGNSNYTSKVYVYTNGKRGQNQGTPILTFQLVNDLLEKYPSRFNHEEVFARADELASYAIQIW